MKRKMCRYKSIIVIVLIIAFAMNSACMFSKYDYDIGKDTVEAFGNGEFQLCKAHDTLLLSNEKCHVVVISSIIGWKEQGNKAYFLGIEEVDGKEIKAYGVLKIKENILQLYVAGDVDAYRQSLIQELCDAGSGVQLTSSTGFLAKDWEILLSLQE